MPIEPTKPGSNPNVSPQTPRASHAPPAASDAKLHAKSVGARAEDQVHLSEAVRELLAKHGVEEIPSGDVSAERLQLVLDRVRQGHYDRPEIRDQILRQVQAEFEDTSPSE